MISVKSSHAWTSRAKLLSRVSHLKISLSRTISRRQLQRFSVWLPILLGFRTTPPNLLSAMPAFSLTNWTLETCLSSLDIRLYRILNITFTNTNSKRSQLWIIHTVETSWMHTCKLQFIHGYHRHASWSRAVSAGKQKNAGTAGMRTSPVGSPQLSHPRRPQHVYIEHPRGQAPQKYRSRAADGHLNASVQFAPLPAEAGWETC